MNDFIFYNPTKIIFGRNALSSLSNQLPKGARVLLTYGGGSVVRNGIYDSVIKELKGFEVIPFGGITSNPDVRIVEKAVLLGRQEQVNFLLALGGGSVIDATKLIAAAIPSSQKPWDIILTGKYDTTLPLGTILTVPATGSEMNRIAVISNRATKEKYSFYSAYPRFSIMDPSYTCTLSPHQISCGIADVFMHTVEQYMTYPHQSGIMDRMAEGNILNLLDVVARLKEHSLDYDIACEYMLSATFALNGFLGMGITQDWLTHKIGHEITALTGVTHGASLAMVYPSVLHVLRDAKGDKLLQFGERIWGVRASTREEGVTMVIHRIADFFRSLGLSASLSEAGVSEAIVSEIATRFRERGKSFGENGIATPEVIAEILYDSYKNER